MKWFILSLGCAFFTATAAALSKLLLQKRTVYFIAWIRFILAIPVFLLIFIIKKPHLNINIRFLKTLAVLLPFELTAFLLYLKSLSISPLSLTFPLLGLTPVFCILFAYLLLGERSRGTGIIGVILVALGAYLLNAEKLYRGLLEPLKNIYREKGSLLMLIVAFLFGITSVIGKKAVLLTDPFTFIAVYYTIFSLILFPFALGAGAKPAGKLTKKDSLLLVLLGVSFTASLFLHFNAIILTNVSYMLAVKRLSLLFSVMYGALVFGEKEIRIRALGAFVIIFGVFILSIS